MDLRPLLTSTVVGAIVAAILTAVWNRRAAKKLPKTERRADAYRDLVVHMASVRTGRGEPDASPRPDLADIKARLLLFGESEVVAAAAAFLAKHASLSGDQAIAEFADVVCAMRKSLLTGHDERVARSIRMLLSAPMPSPNQLGPRSP